MTEALTNEELLIQARSWTRGGDENGRQVVLITGLAEHLETAVRDADILRQARELAAEIEGLNERGLVGDATYRLGALFDLLMTESTRS